MTHDELMARIDDDEKFLDTYFGGKFKGQPALRAVVKLHKPIIYVGQYGNENRCSVGMEFYPCSTIQAIEAELK